MPQDPRRILYDPHIHCDVRIIPALCNDRLIIMSRSKIRVANIEEMSEPPIRFSRVESMTCSLMFFYGRVGGVPNGDCELGANVPVCGGIDGGDCFDVGGRTFFLIVSPGKP
jgi:hypothetical protein